MLHARQLDQTVCHQRTSRNNRLYPTALNHFHNHQIHLGHSHGPRKGEHNGAFRVHNHALQYFRSLAQVSTAKRCQCHPGKQFVDVLGFTHVQGLQRSESILMTIPCFAMQ